MIGTSIKPLHQLRPMHDGSVSATKSIVIRCACIAAAFLCVALFGSAAEGQDSAAKPGWMTGKSTWTGDGYADTALNAADVDTNTKPTMTVSPAAAVQTNPYATSEEAPYSVPVDPAVSTAAGSLDLPGMLSAKTQSVTQAGADLANKLTEKVDDEADRIASVAHQQTLSGPIVGASPLTNPNGIAQQIGQGITLEQPPLIQETTRWYQYPWRWMTEGWSNSIELGLDGSQGNAETLALQTGAELKRKTDAYTLALDFDYRLVNARDVVTEDNGRFNVDYDRLLGDSPWSAFGKFGLEWDEFKVFDLRLNLNAGVGYHWIRNDRSTFVTRFGAGASREIGAPDDDWIPEALFGFDAEHQLNKRNKLKAKVDYFPSWEDFGDYRIVSDASWEILLSEDDSLSLKLAATDRYDSTPQGGNEANDFFYSLLLLVKF